MQAMTKTRLEARVKRLERLLERSQEENEGLVDALKGARAKNRALVKTVAEGRQRENATAAILRVISDSPADAQPVFDSIARAARQLIGGVSAAVTRLDGETLHLAAFTSTGKAGDKAFRDGFSRSISQALVRAVRSRAPYVVADTEKLIGQDRRAIARARGYRSGLFVPLLRGKSAIGTIGVTRREPGPFSDQDIDLLKTFADQAVIAIENVRLFRELEARNRKLTTALDQQTATSDILRVISRSQTDVQPVFDAIVTSAVRLLRGRSGTLTRIAGDRIELAAFTSTDEAGDAAMRATYPLNLSATGPHGCAIRERTPFNSADAENDSRTNDSARAVARARGYRSLVAVPMLHRDEPIGTIGVSRVTGGGFTDDEIALLKTFADQAVIAIENVRLFKELEARNAELTESLEQQTATAEILRVISRSPTDIQPVLDAVAENAAHLCDTDDVFIRRFDGDMARISAHVGSTPVGPDGDARALEPGSIMGTIARERKTIHISDLADPGVRDRYPESRAAGATPWGVRTVLIVPLLRENAAVGAIVVRRREVRPFTDKQISLLETFAAQAVIAIENARLFNDTKEALEQQRVISEILQAISHSPTDTQPVFDAIVKSGVHLFGGLDMTLRLVRGDYHERVASTLNYPPGTSQSEHRIPVNDLRRAQSRAIFNREVVQTPDILDQEAGVEIEQRMSRPFRAHLIAPLMRDDQAIGVLGVFRATPGRFSEKEIALLQTFSSQAVIAIQNVRLFKELQARNADLTEALEQQTVTSEILRIISRSLTDTQPVFDAIVRNGVRLFDGMAVALRLVEGDTAVTVASTRPFGAVPSGAFSVRADDPRSPTARAMHTREIVQIQDFHAPEDWIDPNAIRRADERGFRALLSAPLLREHDSIGAINVTRATPGPFTEKHIALLKTFADQAVIAIENVRLFKELQSRNAEISEALEQQTVTAGILKIISGSPTDTQPVFDAIVRSGERLFDGATVSLRVVKGDNSVIVASTQPLVEAGSTVPLSLDDERRPAVRAIVRREVVHVPDFLTVDWVTEDAKERAEGRGFRAMLCAPMLREGQAVGTINLTRRTPGPFTDKQITILKTFADQAVIAIENVRLFNEIQEKSRQLEIANRHKSEFLANMSHELRTPLNAVIGFSEVLQQGMVGALNEKQGEYINYIHTSGSHLLSLINDILDLSKVEAGRMELDLTCFSVPLAIDNALTLVKERATRHGLNIESTLDPAVAEIHADERKFKQVMLNLLSNAVKFTPEGGSITVAAREVDGMMEVSVTDTGIGIAPEDCEAVFEEFRQVGQDAERKAQGTGLGLALTRKFIELHGGKIWLTSTVGKGSTFYFTLPIAQLELQATA